MVLQAEQNGRYDAWYPGWATALNDERRELMKCFNDRRVEAVHQRGIDVAHGVQTISQFEYMMAASREGVHMQLFTPAGVQAPEFQRNVCTLDANGTQTEVGVAASQWSS